MELDDTDKNIINELAVNSRQSLRKLAKKVSVSVATAMHRVNALEKNNVIKCYTAKIDYEKIGYDVPVMIDVQVSKGKLFQVEKKIAQNPNVVAVYDTTGQFDVTIIAKFKTRRAMDNFLKQLQTYEFVERTNTKLILNTIKESEIKL